MQKLSHAGSSFRESNEKIFTYTQHTYINIKVNKTLQKVNLYNVSQRFQYIQVYGHFNIICSMISLTSRHLHELRNLFLRCDDNSVVFYIYKVKENCCNLHLICEWQLSWNGLNYSARDVWMLCRKQVFIKDVCDELTVLPSLQKPRRISLIGSDGNQYMMMCKAKVLSFMLVHLHFLFLDGITVCEMFWNM
jgi:hypothetical protein